MVNALGRATRAAVHRGNIRAAWAASLDPFSPWVLLRAFSADRRGVLRVAWLAMRQPDGSLFTAAFVALTLSDLAYFTGAGALIGVTPFFVTGPLGSGKAGVGVAVGAFSVTTLLLRPLAGRWTDRHGRRPLLIAGAFLFAVLVFWATCSSPT
jgi:Major Facilitator Superfamily